MVETKKEWRHIASSAGSFAWQLLSFAWLVKVLGRERLRRLLRRRYLLPAAVALSVVMATVGLATFLSLVPYDAQALREEVFAQPDVFARLVLEPSATAPGSNPNLDTSADQPEPGLDNVDRAPRTKRQAQKSGSQTPVEKRAEVKARFSHMFARGGEHGHVGIFGGGAAGSLSGTLSNVIGTNASPAPSHAASSLNDDLVEDSYQSATDDARNRDGVPDESDQETEAKRKERLLPRKAETGALGSAGLGSHDALARGGVGMSLGIGGLGAASGAGGMGYRAATDKNRDVVGSSTPMIMGALDREVIKKIINENKNQIRYCYEVELQRNQDLAGNVGVKWIIGPNGSVTKVMITESTLKNKNVDSCIMAKIQGWKFPTPTDEGTVKVNYSFTFRSTYGDEEIERPSGEIDLSQVARTFVDERNSMEHLTFKDPTGYWANAYIPGHPSMRLLASQLDPERRAQIFSSFGQQLRLDGDARRVAQPFDSPTTAALALYVQANRRGVTEPTRMLVQVGLKGAERHSRARPAMNVGVVLDLTTEPSAESRAAIEALVDALSDARDTGDRFSLVVAGKPGGIIVPADMFRRGPLTVALQQLFGVGFPRGATLSVSQAIEIAIGTVVGLDDPNTPLGTSVVMLVTASTLGPELQTLREMAHEAAVNGVPVSVVGIGSDVRRKELDALALAGQGNRSLLSSPVEAASLVDRELSAVSRVVARALRLRIRLASGVKLVDVIGSHRLDEAHAEVVRQAEQSIDRRLSRNLGIVADRGEDEEGIQIVIPSFYAGDTHIILLDVVAPGPGPIADVRVRYKDLVYLRNGVARANLRVERAQDLVGPLETNVWKNLLAWEVSKAMTKSGVALAAGNSFDADQELARTVALLLGMKVVIPALALDPDVNTDVGMLAEYRSVLSSSDSWGDSVRGYVAASLKYSGFLKVLARCAKRPGSGSAQGE